MGENEGCCKCCCSFIFTSGLTALFMWLSLQADNPKCSVDYFYLPALNKTLNSTTNSTLYFDLKLANPNKDKGINYDDVKVNVTVFDTAGNGSQSSHLGDTTIQRFYQGHKKTAKKPGHVDYNMTVVSQRVFPNATAVFRIDLVTAVRFKIMFWRTKRHKIMVGAKLEVDGTGSMVLPNKKKKDIRLSSMAPKQGCCSLVLLILVINFLVLINLVNFW